LLVAAKLDIPDGHDAMRIKQSGNGADRLNRVRAWELALRKKSRRPGDNRIRNGGY
jgi:hypothetical protein